MALLPRLGPQAAPQSAAVSSGRQPSDDDGSDRSWISRLAGRRLKVPFTGPSLPTLSDWLSEQSVPRSGHKLALRSPGFPQALEGTPCPPPLPVVPSVPQRPTSSSKPKTPLAFKERPLTGSDRPLTGTLLGTGEDGARRRHQHRQRVHATKPRSFVPSMCRVGESEQLVSDHTDFSDDDWLVPSPPTGLGKSLQQDVFTECASGVVISDGSVFANSAAGSLPKGATTPGLHFADGTLLEAARPPDESEQITLRPLKLGDRAKARRVAASGSGGVSPASSRYSSAGFTSRCSPLCAIGSDEDGTLILPKAKALRQLQSGSVATMHMGEDGANYVLSKCRSTSSKPCGAESNAGIGALDGSPRQATWKKEAKSMETSSPAKESPRTDRKWHLRQASLSAAVAQTPRRSKRVVQPGAGGAPVAVGVASPRAGQPAPVPGASAAAELTEKEYLCFEGWAIDDSYLRSLLQVVSLRKTRHINVMDNRLTDSAVELLTEAAETSSLMALESLRLGKNRLGNSGGIQISRLLAEIRGPLQELDLSDCGLSDQACAEVCEVLTFTHPGLVGLSMARNRLGQNSSKAAGALGNLIGTLRKLQALDMHWNNMQGLGAVALLQGLYDNATQIDGQLWRVNLAWNRLGARCQESAVAGAASTGVVRQDCSCEACVACGKIAEMLASIFSDGNVLFHLDISYNHFRASDCAVLAEGLKRNHTLYGLHVLGNEAKIDDVGFLVPMPPVPKGLDRQSIVRHADTVSNINTSVRHTPHLLQIDRVGQLNKVAPTVSDKVLDTKDKSLKARELVVATARQNPSLQMVSGPEVFSEQDIQIEKEWIGVHSRVHRGGADFNAERQFEDVRINERCCWICENWVEETISYIPGWSGPEKALDEVQSVYAYFSIDGYARPTRLSLTNEKYYERTFSRGGGDDIGIHHIHQLSDGPARKPFVDKGRYSVFSGCRALPPSTDPVRVIFQVNERLVVADHMKRVDTPKISVKLHADGRDTAKGGSLPAMAVETGTVEWTEQANVIYVGVRAWERFQRGMLSALCVMEDPRLRGDLKVAPRRLQNERVVKVHEAWKFETSIFKDFSRDSEKVFNQCLEYDFGCSKFEKNLSRYLKDAEQSKEIMDLLRTNYKGIAAAFHGRTLRGFNLTRCTAGLSLLQFTELLNLRSEAVEPEAYMPPVGDQDDAEASAKRKSVVTKKTKGKECLDAVGNSGVFKEGVFRTADGDNIFIAANVVDKANKIVAEMTLPNQGLARFQFMEALARTAFARFLPEKDTPVAAMETLLQALNIGAQQVYLRETLHAAMFCEECDLVLRQRMRVLETAFNKYSKRLQFPGRGGIGSRKRNMTFGGWLEFIADCEPGSFGISHLDYGSAFALGKETRVDEYTSFRGMELSWSEFLLSIGAVVRLSGRFKPEYFSDQLLEFIEEHVTRATTKHGIKNAKRYGQDPEIVKMVELIGRVFAEADTDNNGCLNQQELGKFFRQRAVVQSFREIYFNSEDIKVLFARMDTDESGDITLDELCHGMVAMKKAMAGLERGVAFLRKAFEDADTDKSGTLTVTEFHTLLSNQTVRDKLQTMGISYDEIDDLWAAVDANAINVHKRDGVTCEEMVSGLLAMREPSSKVTRGLHFMHQIFKTADVDQSGCLTPSELDEVFDSTEVEAKLKSLGLGKPDWLGIFSAIDADGDGELSWQELQKGLRSIWEDEEKAARNGQ